jgi:hypothetical protein
MGINLSGTGKVAAIWLILALFSHGELSYRQGLSAVTKLFQQKNCWFMMAFGFGNSQFRIYCFHFSKYSLSILKWYSARFEFSKTELLSPLNIYFTGLGFEYYC